MLKLMGAMLLLGGGLALGLGAVGELDTRARGLSAMAAALNLLEGELAFRLSPMPDLLETLAHRAPQPAAAFFTACGRGMEHLGERPFEMIWADALAEEPMGLADEDRLVLRELGPVLGRYGLEDQRRAAEAARQRLEAAAERVRECRRREGRAYGTLGLAMGAFVTILLL